MNKIWKVGMIGFGLSGRYFFAPFIRQHPNLALSVVVSSQKKAVAERYPDVKVIPTVDTLWDDPSIDLVVVASPNQTHYKYAKAALLSAKHVVVEKPLAITVAEVRSLVQLAKAQGKVLAPFQNRRWDGDFLTVKKLLEQGTLGEIFEFESHFDRYRPVHNRVAWKNDVKCFGGVLYDLGPHLIDQALALFGKPKQLFADVRSQREGVETEDYFEIHLFYTDKKVILKAGVFVAEPSARFVVRGRKGSYVKYGLDPQEGNLRNEMQADNPLLGLEEKANNGVLYAEKMGEMSQELIETEKGNYAAFFENLVQAISGAEELEARPEDGLLTIALLNKAFESSELRQVLSL